MHPGLLGPAVGFVGFELEFGDGFDAVTRWHNFCVGGVELVSDRSRAGECSVAFFVEAGRNGFDGVCQEIVVIGDDEGETGFYGGELGEHGDERRLHGCKVTWVKSLKSLNR